MWGIVYVEGIPGMFKIFLVEDEVVVREGIRKNRRTCWRGLIG
jgi:hypothetical protein